MRDAWFAVTWMLLLPVTVMSAHVGILLWIWVALLSPNEVLYGIMTGVPFNKVVAITTIVSLLFNAEKKDLYLDAIGSLLLLFAIIAAISWYAAMVPGPSNDDLFQKILKEIVLFFMITNFMHTRIRIHSVIIIICLSIGFFAVKEGLIFSLTAGGHNINGSGAIGDNNALAAAMLMIIPLLFYLGNYSALKGMRIGFYFTLALSIIATIGTYSRGGFAGMIILGFFLLKNSGNKVRSAIFIVLCCVLIYSFAPATWFDRLNTINSASEDGSFMGRVGAWKMSLLVALDHPLTGAGPHSLQRLLVWETYRPSLYKLDFIYTPPADALPRAAHSIWFEILGDLGFVGFALFIAILSLAFWKCHTIIKMTRNRPLLAWAADLARMLQVSLAVYVTTGSALSLGYFEMYYIVLALLSRLDRTVKQILAEQARFTNTAMQSANPGVAPQPAFARTAGRPQTSWQA